MIQGKLKTAIAKLSEKHNLSIKDIRIKISRIGGKLNYDIMRKGEVLENVTLAQALNLNAFETFMANNKLEQIFERLSNVNSVPQERMNVRIYTESDDCSPLFYLFDGTEAKRSLSYNEITD